MNVQKFNVDTAGLTAYVDENRTELLYQLQMASELTPYAEVRTGIKGTERMHFMTTTATFQTDSCSYNASDTTTFTEKDLTVGKIAIMEDICVKSLNGFWTQQIIAAGARNEETPIPSEIASAWTSKKLNLVKRQINVADWQGDTASGTANLNKYDGLIKEVFADGSVIDGNPNDIAGPISESNILTAMKDMYLSIPEDLRAGAPDGGGLVWFLPQAYYDFYVIALRDSNLFHFKGEEGVPTYFGTDIPLIPQVGLASQDKMIITTRDNIQIGVDLESDEDTLDVWYSMDDRINKSLIAFKRGITYKFSNYIIKFGLGTS